MSVCNVNVASGVCTITMEGSGAEVAGVDAGSGASDVLATTASVLGTVPAGARWRRGATRR